MTSYNYEQGPSAPTMYPIMQENIRPVPPVRREFMQDPQQQSLIGPDPPPRMDKQPIHTRTTDVTLRRVNIQIMFECSLKKVDYIIVLIHNLFFFNT